MIVNSKPLHSTTDNNPPVSELVLYQTLDNREVSYRVWVPSTARTTRASTIITTSTSTTSTRTTVPMMDVVATTSTVISTSSSSTVIELNSPFDTIDPFPTSSDGTRDELISLGSTKSTSDILSEPTTLLPSSFTFPTVAERISSMGTLTVADTFSSPHTQGTTSASIVIADSNGVDPTIQVVLPSSVPPAPSFNPIILRSMALGCIIALVFQ
ncbi:hypothetical protein VNI00_010885 [Paramarasmius palmivorus]|uniref:Uncharacterized protein n=1 Tax=Paramarasmius palmivorus TaxID=297713 RepID=A0AAW0CG43_9AGAR